MRRSELEHLIRAASAITDQYEKAEDVGFCADA